MLNDQQRLELPLPTLQPVPVPQVDYPGHRSRGHLVLASSLLVTGSLLLVSVLLFITWGSALLTPRAQRQAQVTHATPHVPQRTPTVQATPTLSSAQIVSQVDHLLSNQVSHQ